MKKLIFQGPRFAVHLVFLLLIWCAALRESRAQGTYFAEDTTVLSNVNATAYTTFTLSQNTSLVLRVVSDYSVDAGIFTPSNYNLFSNGQASSGWALFSSQFGTKSVTLSAGSYVVAVRSRVSSANNVRYELDMAYSVPGQTRINSQVEAETVGPNGGTLVQPFTIPSGQSVYIDGANLGLEFYLIPASEVSNFRNNQTFNYYTDYEPTESSNQPGGFKINLPPGSYSMAFRNRNTITKQVTYAIEWWTGGPVGGVTAPSISTPPSSQTVAPGQTVSFSVTASGTAPFTYQWRKNSSAISGANSATYSISNVASSHAGNYSVVVSNSAGSATSNAATLTVAGGAPVFVGSPTATGTVGQSFTYSAVFTGNPSGFAASGLPSGLNINPGTGIISGIPAVAGTFTVYIAAANSFDAGSGTLTLTIGKAGQTIAFDAVPDKLTTSPSFSLTASATSGLPVSFSLLSGPATLFQNTVSLTGTAGTVTIRASQGGNASFNAAAPVDRSFTVSSAPASGFPAFMNASGVPANQRETWQDPDNDRIPNLLEYLLLGNPAKPDAGLLPTMTTTPFAGGQTILFTYKRGYQISGVTQIIEHSTSPNGPFATAVHGQNGVDISVSYADLLTDRVTVTIPSAGPKRFVRLRVIN